MALRHILPQWNTIKWDVNEWLVLQVPKLYYV